MLTPQLETEEIAEYELCHNNINYLLVDTPGFDDTCKSNAQVVSEIKKVVVVII
jgi:hypothetical protein